MTSLHTYLEEDAVFNMGWLCSSTKKQTNYEHYLKRLYSSDRYTEKHQTYSQIVVISMVISKNG